jgi:very-short-patch-repair endonuclease
VLHGLPVFALPPRPEVTDRRQNGLGHRPASHVHGASIVADDVTAWFGVPVLTVARTLVDLGRHDRRDAIMAADAALREGLVTPAEIATALSRATGGPGVRQARAVLALADPRAESPLESLVRLVLHDDGFPPPDLQRTIGGDRVDMVFDEQRLILEIDGLDKYRLTTMAEEKRRERRLRRAGYRVERLTWDEVVRDWPQTRRWLRPLFGLPV